jgi:hypothetical protein
MSEERKPYAETAIDARKRELEQAILALLRIWEREHPAMQIVGARVMRAPGVDRTELADLALDVRAR